MKANIGKYKSELAQQAERDIVHVFSTYEPGDLGSLGKLCHSIVTLSEWYWENRDSDAGKRVPRLLEYLDDKFKNTIVLVLRKGHSHYGYSPSNVMKFVRGESVHGASVKSEPKRAVMHDFVFEKDHGIENEFQVSWNWIVGPNLRAATGNRDTEGALIHSLSVNERKIEVSLIESVAFAVAYEFWQANTNQEPKESSKVFVKFNPRWFAPAWGDELATKAYKSLTDYYGITPPERPDGSG